ncbi:hypothetical protein MPER_09826 [Moniliophthora perniciosa FA553]|nr:hypothetical protein MPER_09826 [Moniliophthora perniciosa FA553]
MTIGHTAAEHAATALAVIGEAIPPVKAVAALSSITDLSRAAQGNTDEAFRLGNFAEDMLQRLLNALNGAQDFSPEVSAAIGRELQVLQSVLDEILVALQELQPKNTICNRLTRSLNLNARDHKEKLAQLQKKLEDAFRAYLFGNIKAIRTDLARLRGNSNRWDRNISYLVEAQREKERRRWQEAKRRWRKEKRCGREVKRRGGKERLIGRRESVVGRRRSVVGSKEPSIVKLVL